MAPKFGIGLLAIALLWAPAVSASAYIRTDSLAPGGCPVPVAMATDILPDLPPELIPDLLTWIAAATDYDITASRADPPAIQFCVGGEIVPYEGAPLTVPGDLNAALDWPENRILLVRPWSPDNLRDRSALLHELIHHVQLQNRGYECPQAAEWQAYKLQERWLAEQGIESGFDWLQIFFWSRCPRDHHP